MRDFQIQIDHLWPFSECQRSQVWEGRDCIFSSFSHIISHTHLRTLTLYKVGQRCCLYFAISFPFAKFTKCKIDNVLMNLSPNLFSVDVDQLTDLVILPVYCHNCWKKGVSYGYTSCISSLTDEKHISTFYVFDFYPSASCPHSSLATDTVSICSDQWKKKNLYRLIIQNLFLLAISSISVKNTHIFHIWSYRLTKKEKEGYS